MLELFLLLLIGVVSATIGSLVGLGGGIIIVPSLIYLSPVFFDGMVTTERAVGTSLAVLIFTALTSTLTFVKQKKVDLKSGLLFFSASGPAAIFGASLTGFMESGIFQFAFGVFMLLMAVLLVLRDRMKPLHIQWSIQRTYVDVEGKIWNYGYGLVPALAVGFVVGFISGVFGIGGGSLFVPAMVMLFNYPPHVATATSMFVIFLSAVLGSSTHAFLGNIDFWLLLGLAPGAVIGGWLGAWISSRLSSKRLLWILRITFFIVALRMMWEGLETM